MPWLLTFGLENGLVLYSFGLLLKKKMFVLGFCIWFWKNWSCAVRIIFSKHQLSIMVLWGKKQWLVFSKSKQLFPNRPKQSGLDIPLSKDIRFLTKNINFDHEYINWVLHFCRFLQTINNNRKWLKKWFIYHLNSNDKIRHCLYCVNELHHTMTGYNVASARDS